MIFSPPVNFAEANGILENPRLILIAQPERLPGEKNNKGKSEALNKGFQYCEGKIIITMDGDLQDDPSEINNFIKIIKNNQCDMVSGWKKHRKDPISKTFPSKIFNVFLRLISGIKLNDFNCGFKAYKINVVKSLTLYG